MEGIDKIYLINLDHRPDRLASVQNALAPYGIYPCRFPAVYGRKLPLETLLNLAYPSTSENFLKGWVTTPMKDGTLGYTFLNKNGNKPVFCESMTIGAVGCALSHLTILQEAYDKGYETIWVMEDDIWIQGDPRLLSGLITKLDLITDRNWDLLYTDSEEEISGSYWWMRRPEYAQIDEERFSYRHNVDEDFVKIGSRNRTHSMIIRRSGMKKILDHLESNHLFLPIDNEIPFAQDINLYMLSYPVVTYNRTEDTDIQKPQEFISDNNPKLKEYRKSILQKSHLFTGWCSSEKAICLMDFIYHHKPNLCVEIGAFGGSTSYPIASTLRFLKRGHLYAIDAWSTEEALKSFSFGSCDYMWWATVDFNAIKKNFEMQLVKLKLTPWCTMIQNSSLKAVSEFPDGVIDMLYVDGNSSETGSLEDLIAYFPKVKHGGYIWLNDANSPLKYSSMVYLTDNATFIPEESLRNNCVVFQKAPLD